MGVLDTAVRAGWRLSEIDGTRNDWDVLLRYPSIRSPAFDHSHRRFRTLAETLQTILGMQAHGWEVSGCDFETDAFVFFACSTGKGPVHVHRRFVNETAAMASIRSMEAVDWELAATDATEDLWDLVFLRPST